MERSTFDHSHPRSYVSRLRRDPRVRAMLDGWIAEATFSAEQRFPDPHDDRERTAHAVQTALMLAMSFFATTTASYKR